MIELMKKIATALLTFYLIFNLSGCKNSDEGLNAVFKYDISSNPQTLDPQIADEPNSCVIIENVFMGLLRKNKDGSLSEGAAKDYVVSNDGLVYDFKLRQDIYWIDGDEFEKQCTAADFVYGFRRLFAPETQAPRAGDYFCIKNSSLINSGKLTDYSMLGVKATGEFELRITLEYPDSRFLSLLAEPPAMPCNEEFFLNSQGKYGLSAECTPSNGAFYVKSWTYDPYAITDINNLILGRNYKNAEAFEICPAGLNFFIEDEENFITDFLNREVSCVAASNDEKSLIKGKYSCEEFNSITCGLLFNKSFSLFSGNDFCKALSLLADRTAIISAIPEFSAAEGIVPEQVTNYRKAVGSCSIDEYNLQKAHEYFDRAESGLDSSLLSGARIIVPDAAAQTAVSYIMQEWQREFGFYCVVEVLDEREYLNRLKSGDYEIAVVELTGEYDSPKAFLEQFTSASSGNYGKVSDSSFEQLMKEAENSADASEAAEIYFRAEQLLIDKAYFLPLYYKNVYFFTAEDCKDIIYNPFSKTIDFTLAKRFD